MFKLMIILVTFYYSCFSHASSKEMNLIPKVCTEYPNSPSLVCGGGATFYINLLPPFKSHCHQDKCDYLVLTAAHLVYGSSTTVCLENKCYSAKLKNSLIDAKNDIAIIHLKIPEEDKFDPSFAVIKDIQGNYIFPALNDLPLGNISKNSSLNGHHQVITPLGDLIFSKATIVGSSQDSELTIKKTKAFTNPPYVPINLEMIPSNKDANYKINKKLDSLEPLKTLFFSKRKVTSAHLGPGSSGSPLIFFRKTYNLYTHFGGVVNTHNYRLNKSLISSDSATKTIINKFIRGKRGKLANYNGKAFVFKFDPLINDTYRELEDETISESLQSLNFSTETDENNSGGGDGGNSGGGDGGNSGGGDGGNSDDKDQGQNNYEDHIPGIIYEGKHTIGFKLTRDAKTFNIFANSEALLALDALQNELEFKVTPIRYNQSTNFLNLFQENTSHKNSNKKFCKDDHCFTLNKSHKSHIEILYFNQLNTSLSASIKVYSSGRIEVKTSYGEQLSYPDFRPWIKLPHPTGFLQLDIRNIFMADLTNIYTEKLSDQDVDMSFIKQIRPYIILISNDEKKRPTKKIYKVNLN